MCADRKGPGAGRLPTADEVQHLSANLRRAWPVDQNSYFVQLLRDIDEAYRNRRPEKS